MDLRQLQARALGDPTRHAMMRALAEADAPMTVASLTARFGLNHNAIRQHLAKLRDAGLVTERLSPHAGPGRPALVYEPSLSSEVWLTAGPYEQLALMLLDMWNSGRSAREVGAAVGGHAPQPASFAEAADVVCAEMSRRGFDPERVVDTGRTVEVVLNHCPFATAALSHPDVVCDLHLGIAEGVTASLARVELSRRAPREGGCRLRMSEL